MNTFDVDIWLTPHIKITVNGVQTEATAENPEAITDAALEQVVSTANILISEFYDIEITDISPERDPENGSMTISAALNPPPRPVQEF